MREKINESKKKPLKIQGFTITTLLAYFIIYSIVGFIIETIFGIITKGTWESRQSFLYGPFCAIYGFGAAIMIMFLHKYSKNYTRLFIGGFIVGIKNYSIFQNLKLSIDELKSINVDKEIYVSLNKLIYNGKYPIPSYEDFEKINKEKSIDKKNALILFLTTDNKFIRRYSSSAINDLLLYKRKSCSIYSNYFYWYKIIVTSLLLV